MGALSKEGAPFLFRPRVPSAMILPVPRYRIRYQGTDLEMPAGEFVVGRSSTCNLALDDALVSRRHATILVQPDGVWVDDLGSRNGVAVNGERIDGRRKVAHLDRITIGSHDLMLVEIPDKLTYTVPCESCGLQQSPDNYFCSRCGNPVSKGSPTLAGMTLEIPSPLKDVNKTQKLEAARVGPLTPAPEENTGTGAALLTGIADKAIAMGRFEEAERVLGRSLSEILSRSKSAPSSMAAHRLQEGTRYALKLAEGTRRTTWLDWVFDLHAATGRLLSSDEIEKLHDLVRKLRYTGVGPVRRYVEVVRQRAHELGPAERFLLQRLEGIERLVSA